MAKLTDRVREGAQALIGGAAELRERISARARAIWEREGKPEGRREEHWSAAEKEIGAEESERSKKKPASASKTTKEKQGSPTGRKTRKSAAVSGPVADATTAEEAAETAKSAEG